jgi:predicted HTH domain antitoxin
MLNLAVDPQEVLDSVTGASADPWGELRLAAAIHWYQQGRMSQERAASFAGFDRAGFLDELARREVDVFTVDFEDLGRELARG